MGKMGKLKNSVVAKRTIQKRGHMLNSLDHNPPSIRGLK